MEEKIPNKNPESVIPLDSDLEKDFNNKKLNKVLIIISLFIFGLIVGVGYYLYTNNSTIQSQLLTPKVEVESKLEITEDIPFKEMTIPYLRDRNYDSLISELDEISSNSNYTSYLASYDSDGLKVFGLLTKPSGQMPTGGFPAIVFVHGYIPPTTYQTLGTSYSDYVDYLARNGFVVFKIDLRGHGNSEGEAHGAYYSGDYIVDVLNARSALQKLDFVNSGKIGLWGHSMAGNVIFRSFVAAKDVPAIVIWGGAVYTYEDMRGLGIDDDSYRPPTDESERQRRRELLFNTHGEFDPNSEFWKTVVPTNYLDGISGAVQLDHAINDNVVNIEYSRGLSQILNETNIEHELNEYQSGGHNISGSAFEQAMQDTVRFFKENL